MTTAAASRPSRKLAPLLPRQDARDGALIFVVTVLCFLACLAVLAAQGANRAAQGWQAQLIGSATVLVRPTGSETADAAAARAAETLSGVRGVVQAAALEKEKAQALLKPWLGQDVMLEDLPVPRLVSVELDPKAPATANMLAKALKAAGIDATVDDHSLWLKDVLRAGAVMRWAAIGIASLIAAAAAAVVAFATRAGLAARDDLVSVLHLTGAENGFIADLFQVRFAGMAGWAGLLGAGGAAMIAAAIRWLGGGAGLTPMLPLAWIDLLAILPCPLIAALIAALAARVTAIGLIKGMV